MKSVQRPTKTLYHDNIMKHCDILTNHNCDQVMT